MQMLSNESDNDTDNKNENDNVSESDNDMIVLFSLVPSLAFIK